MIKVNDKEIEFKQFPNGETLVLHDSFPTIDFGQYVVISFKYEEDGDLIKLMLVKEYLEDVAIKNDNILYSILEMYHTPYGRMDRSEEGSPFTLKYVSNFINWLDFMHVDIVEPHSSVTLDLVNKSRKVDVIEKLSEKVLKEIYFNKYLDCVVFPDEGSKKRYSHLFPEEEFKFLVGDKTRDFKTGRITGLSLAGDIGNDTSIRNALIVDDMSSYGGTFIRCARELWNLGFENVYLLTAHAEDSIYKGQLFSHITKMFTTDSMLTDKDYPKKEAVKEQLKIYSAEDIML